eukprot:COSAG02_NODE_2982_length_7621_cov_3.542808_5_plen_91_part_00
MVLDAGSEVRGGVDSYHSGGPYYTTHATRNSDGVMVMSDPEVQQRDCFESVRLTVHLSRKVARRGICKTTPTEQFINNAQAEHNHCVVLD